MEPIAVLQNKTIVLAVTGSIACYKAVDLASKLTQAGAQVDVVMTEAAQRFVTPLTFQSVTGRGVYTNLWQTDGGSLPTHVAHVGLGEEADLMAVIPATANTLARLAQGMADDLLTVTALALRASMMVAPAMDAGMYSHPAVQRNTRILRDQGVTIIEPEEGRFASGMIGKGRLPETPTLLGYMRRALGQDGGLLGMKAVVSAGGTREPIDPVRYITNRSSGRQGHALAQAAVDAGAREVVLVTASDLPAPIGVQRVDVGSADEMRDAILQHSQDADLLVMAAAVADFRPEAVADQKIKKDSQESGLTLTLSRTSDILMAVKGQRENTGFPRMVVGFAAESENLVENALSKLERKGVDLLVANDITAQNAGFSANTNQVLVLDMDGGQHPIAITSKSIVSEAIIARAAAMLRD